MIRLKKLIKESNVWDRKFGEPLPTLRLEQEDKYPDDAPDHFGGGENIDIFGYQTKHYDICKSAVDLFTTLNVVTDEEAQKYIVNAAKDLDHIFEMEKSVVMKKPVNHDPIKHGIELINTISYQLGYVGKIINKDFMNETTFMPFHVQVMVNRKDDIKIEKNND